MVGTHADTKMTQSLFTPIEAKGMKKDDNSATGCLLLLM
jgi:hypothetical protein